MEFSISSSNDSSFKISQIEIKKFFIFNISAHSLGCQLAAFIGKFLQERTSQKISRITALDPAGPRWINQEMDPNEMLCASDANFVDVVHTDIYYSGFKYPIGHVDFYANEGKHQPGCPPRETYGT